MIREKPEFFFIHRKPYVALLNLFQWTYGLYLITGEKEVIHLKAVLKNPVFLGLCAGLVFFLLPVKIPGIITKTIGYMADMNTPLAMIVLGSYLVKTDIKSIFFALVQKVFFILPSW